MPSQQWKNLPKEFKTVINFLQKALTTSENNPTLAAKSWHDVNTYLDWCLKTNNYDEIQSLAAPLQESILRVFPAIKDYQLDYARPHLRGLLQLLNSVGFLPEDPLRIQEIFLETLFLEYVHEYPELFQLHMDILNETYEYESYGVYEDYAIDVVLYALSSGHAAYLSSRFVEDGFSAYVDQTSYEVETLSAEPMVGYLFEMLPHEDWNRLKSVTPAVPLDSYTECRLLPLSSDVTAWLLHHVGSLYEAQQEEEPILKEIVSLPQLTWEQLGKCQAYIQDLAPSWYKVLRYINHPAFVTAQNLASTMGHMTVGEFLHNLCPQL